jgi:hypothetical protein
MNWHIGEIFSTRFLYPAIRFDSKVLSEASYSSYRRAFKPYSGAMIHILAAKAPSETKTKLHFWRFERLTTHCRHMDHTFELLPGHAPE